MGYFVWKITMLRQKKLFFPILGGGPRAGCAPPGSAPAVEKRYSYWLPKVVFRTLLQTLSLIICLPYILGFLASMSSGSHILALLSKHWWLNCSTFALQSSELWIKFMLFKALPMSSDLSCSDLVEDLCKLE
jgi:hypothetical protein